MSLVTQATLIAGKLTLPDRYIFALLGHFSHIVMVVVVFVLFFFCLFFLLNLGFAEATSDSNDAFLSQIIVEFFCPSRNLLVNLGLFAAGVWVARNLSDFDLMSPQPVT